MAEDNIILSDKNTRPDDEYIFSIIGNNKILWQDLMNHMHENYDNTSGVWNFYNDGKRWLFKFLKKKKTVFWISILKDTFRVTFWFGDKAEPLIESSDLPQSIKEEFYSAKKYGLVRSVTIKMENTEDLNNVIKLVVIKCKMK